jgi:nitrogen-specific signal transduction histidine kinase/CheY-like chemotaxis protein
MFINEDVSVRLHLEAQCRQTQKMEAVGQLAGGIAHDFNNLLTVINGCAELVIQGLHPADPARELLTVVLRAGERSAVLTRQLLAFSRQQVLAPRLLDLNAVVADVEKMLHRMIGEDVDLSLSLDPELGAVLADPGQIEQVLLNLAVNARDAMPTGGRLTIETRNVELDPDFARTHPGAPFGQHVYMAVTDTGTGMTAEVQSRLFEPFFTTKGLGKGTGLGLATVYGIVQQSDGYVEVTSEIGRGTRFMIYLPRLQSAVGAASVVSAIESPPKGSETVLLAEDDDGVRTLSRRVLEECGYTVLHAASAEEALETAEHYPSPIDLLVTDVVMPGAGGRQLAEGLRATRPGLKVLFLSGYTDDAVVRHGILHASVNFLQKPFVPALLALRVREVLDQASTRASAL